MHVSTHSTNLNFTVPVTSNTQLHQASVSVLECRQQDQHIAGTCDTEDEIPATVISSVGTINYHQSAQSHQLFVVASGNHHTTANDHCNAIYLSVHALRDLLGTINLVWRSIANPIHFLDCNRSEIVPLVVQKREEEETENFL